MPKKDFLFVDLATVADISKPFDCMAAGQFTDMWGYDFEIKAEDLPESTRDSEGNVVGFPIDTMGHNHREAAGWILDVKQVGSIVQSSVRWNDLGRELIGSDQVRFFSPTIDIETRVIMGGSLTNWPATRTKDHQILLRPVELSEQLQALNDVSFLERVEMIVNKAISGLSRPGNPPATTPDITLHPRQGGVTEEDMTLELEKLTPEQRTTLLRSALAAGALPAEMQAQIETRATELANVKLSAEKRQTHIAEFTARVAGGTAEKPVGLPIPADDLAKFMAALTPEAQEQLETILTRIVDSGMVDFKEHGSSLTQTGNAVLPPEIAVQLKKWMEIKGNSIDEFFTVNAVELGAMADYNLSEFKEK